MHAALFGLVKFLTLMHYNYYSGYMIFHDAKAGNITFITTLHKP
jgi:hypothetical protein